MNRVSIHVPSVQEVLKYYDQIKVFRCDTEDGFYLEESEEGNRPVLNISTEIYWYTDVEGTSSHWYKTAYFNSVTLDESILSDPIQGGQSADRVGYSFGNYSPPDGEWGDVFTPDDLRYTYMWGIDLIGGDANTSYFLDSQLRYFIESSLADFERYLDIDIRRRKYIYDTTGKVRSDIWRQGVDYTHEDGLYDFEPRMWYSFGALYTRHRPLLSVQTAQMFSPLGGALLDLKGRGWLTVTNKNYGRLNCFPRNANNQYFPTVPGVLFWANLKSGKYPNAIQLDYETGFESARFVPKDLRDVIGKWAAIKTLAVVGDGFTGGVASQSVSLDGLSESLSTTMSATSAWYGARIKEYQDEIKDWLERNRMKYSIPIAFVTS